MNAPKIQTESRDGCEWGGTADAHHLCLMCVPAMRQRAQMMAQNLRGEMLSDLAGAKITLSDSRFIQVIAKSLSISCTEVSGLFHTAGRECAAR